jgi:hypothetical protein
MNNISVLPLMVENILKTEEIRCPTRHARIVAIIAVLAVLAVIWLRKADADYIAGGLILWGLIIWAVLR